MYYVVKYYQEDNQADAEYFLYNGYGDYSYWEELKDDGWRSACDSIDKLNEWWAHNREGMLLENYHIVKYILYLNNMFRILKTKETYMIDFKLSEVISKEDFE